MNVICLEGRSLVTDRNESLPTLHLIPFTVHLTVTSLTVIPIDKYRLTPLRVLKQRQGVGLLITSCPGIPLPK